MIKYSEYKKNKELSDYGVIDIEPDFVCPNCNNKNEYEFLINRKNGFIVCYICGHKRKI